MRRALFVSDGAKVVIVHVGPYNARVGLGEGRVGYVDDALEGRGAVKDELPAGISTCVVHCNFRYRFVFRTVVRLMSTFLLGE